MYTNIKIAEGLHRKGICCVSIQEIITWMNFFVRNWDRQCRRNHNYGLTDSLHKKPFEPSKKSNTNKIKRVCDSGTSKCQISKCILQARSNWKDPSVSQTFKQMGYHQPFRKALSQVGKELVEDAGPPPTSLEDSLAFRALTFPYCPTQLNASPNSNHHLFPQIAWGKWDHSLCRVCVGTLQDYGQENLPSLMSAAYSNKGHKSIILSVARHNSIARTQVWSMWKESDVLFGSNLMGWTYLRVTALWS